MRVFPQMEEGEQKLQKCVLFNNDARIVYIPGAISGGPSAVSYQEKPAALVVVHISIVRRGMGIICKPRAAKNAKRMVHGCR